MQKILNIIIIIIFFLITACAESFENIKLGDNEDEVTDIEELIQLGKDQNSSINLEQGSGNVEESVLKKIRQK